MSGVTRGLRVLLKGIVDYAGLYPPAALPMEEAVRNYAAYRLHNHAWMLGRFICPDSRLDELQRFGSMIFSAGEPPWRLAVTWPGGQDLPSFLTQLQQTITQIKRFTDQHPESVCVECLEARLPESVVAAGASQVRELVERAAEVLAAARLSTLTPLYELKVAGSRPDLGAKVLQALQSFNADWAKEDRYHAVGAKIRMGGAEKTAFPSCREVAFFVAATVRLGLAFKATAGLHHPIRNPDSKLEVYRHGFLNLYTALAFTCTRAREVADIVAVLESQRHEDFEFAPEIIRWKGQQMTLAHIETGRQLGLSFGSCSFEEPLQGLQDLGLI